MNLKCKLHRHQLSSFFLRQLALWVLVLSIILSPFNFRSLNANAQTNNSATAETSAVSPIETTTEEQYTNAVNQKTDQVYKLFSQLPDEKRKQISSAILGALLNFENFKSYLNSNQTISNSFPLTTIPSENNPEQKYYIITSNKISNQELSKTFSTIEPSLLSKPTETLNSAESEFQILIPEESLSETDSIEKSNAPLTQAVQDEIKDSHQKERFSKLLNTLNNSKAVLSIRFRGQMIFITSGLYFLNDFDLASAVLKGFLGGTLSRFFGVLDEAGLFKFINIVRERHNKKVEKLKERVDTLSDYANKYANSNLSEDIDFEAESLKYHLDNLNKKLTYLRTAKTIQSTNFSSFIFLYSFTELFFMTTIHVFYDFTTTNLNTAWNHFYGVNLFDHIDKVIPWDWFLGISLASITQGSADGILTNYKNELDKWVAEGKMDSRKVTAIYRSLRITVSLLSVSSAILAQSGATWFASAGFGSLAAMATVVQRKTKKFENARMNGWQTEKQVLPLTYNRCISLY